jgi:multidrug efflux system outer membrane protein
MQKTLFSLAAAAMAASVLSACSLAPVYERPAAPVTAGWPQGDAYKPAPVAADAKPAADIAWRDYFADERLRQVIALALANNRDLRVSALNIEKARAQYGIQRAALVPSVTASGGQNATRTADKMSANGQGAINRQYTANLGVSYELDFFGKVRSLSEAALQQYLGTEEARRAQQISLVAEVASTWLALQADRERLRLAADTLKSQQITYELSKRRFDAGATSGLDMYEAQTSVEAARNDMAVYTAQVAQGENALALVVGTSVPAELQQQPAPLASVAAMAELPACLPSEVLQRRPDVLGAERTLQAANANIGAARAAFFPSISLTGTAGSASSNLSGLFKAGSGTWSFLPQINLPIFNGGANTANLTVAKVERDIAVARYEQAIQSAFREVADALAQRGTLDERLASQVALADASQKSFRIHEARYQKGSESYLNALVSQRALYAAQQSLISARLARADNQVTLYKVLGGGYQ